MKAEKGSNWQDLLNRWLSGRITAREEQELDRLAQDDPFLAGAMEGYRSQPERDHLAQVSALKERFQKRENRSFPPIWRIAAAAAVLIVTGLAWWQLNPSGGQDLAQMEPSVQEEALPLQEAPESLALEEDTEVKPEVEIETARRRSLQTKTPPPPAPPAPAKPPAVEKKAEQADDGLRLAPPAENTSRELARTTLPQPAPYEENAVEREELSKGLSLQAPTVAAIERDSSAVFIPASPPTPNLYVAQTEIAEARNRRTKLVSGVIRSESGEPLSGATIRVPGTTGSAVTEYDGRFSITVPLETQQLQMTYLNEEQMLQIGGRDSFALDIENRELMETVVTGFGKRRPRKLRSSAAPLPTDTAEADETSETPRPSVDSTAYRQYVRENLRYPDAARQARITGEVTVQFSIDGEGRPNNFLMIRSLGYGCDEEAIRLIREGPPWIAPEGSLATYTVRFEL